MIHLGVIGCLALALAFLVRARLVQVDLSFPWFLAIVVLGLASTQPVFVDWLGIALNIQYAPIAVVFLVIFLMVGVIVSLTISVTRLRARQVAIVRQMALRDLDAQEWAGR